MVFSLEQNSGCSCRQAFIHYCGLHQVWGRTEKLHLIRHSFQFSLRPDEVHSSGWNLVYNYNQSSVPEKNHLCTTRDNRMRNLHKIKFIKFKMCMCMYWIILILTLISTLNVPICKFKYQSMCDHYAYHYLFDHYADYYLFDHYAYQHLFDHCADHHLSDHHANIIQLSKL